MTAETIKFTNVDHKELVSTNYYLFELNKATLVELVINWGEIFDISSSSSEDSDDSDFEDTIQKVTKRGLVIRLLAQDIEEMMLKGKTNDDLQKFIHEYSEDNINVTLKYMTVV